jgi:hypothetical protein
MNPYKALKAVCCLYGLQSDCMLNRQYTHKLGLGTIQGLGFSKFLLRRARREEGTWQFKSSGRMIV